ncbi:MAG: hypothetical protein VX699_13270, partial [Myxococcota bacterium]|nr:hypothetical protein [Myxococcota bacterium]
RTTIDLVWDSKSLTSARPMNPVPPVIRIDLFSMARAVLPREPLIIKSSPARIKPPASLHNSNEWLILEELIASNEWGIKKSLPP